MKSQQISVCGFLTDDKNRLLIARRSEEDSFMPGMWELIGGGVEFAEDPYEALKREFNEELGINIRPLFPYYTFSYTTDEKGEITHETEIDMFVKLIDPISEIKVDQQIHSETAWINEHQVAKFFQPQSQESSNQINSVIQGFKMIDLAKEFENLQDHSD